MKLVHLADLHLGKRVNGFSMIEDQKYILKEILRVIGEEAPQAVLIAGDIYDKSIPSEEAVGLFDQFLVELISLGQQVFLIAGNHDSAERLAFGGRLMGASGVHVSRVYDGTATPVTLTDEHGAVYIYALPFVKPVHVRRAFPEAEIGNYTDAVFTAISAMHVKKQERNVLLTHQFVAGSLRCDSEEISVGGTDQVDASVFEEFDYVALGHLHGPQQAGRTQVRYAGSPLKYSFSEASHVKSVTVVELGKKGDLEIRTVPLTPLRDLVELRGTYEELMLRDFYEGKDLQQSYVHITLTDEDDIPNAQGRLRVIYPNLMKLDYDNRRTRATTLLEAVETTEQMTPLELFASFFVQQNDRPMSEQQMQYMEKLVEEIWEVEP